MVYPNNMTKQFSDEDTQKWLERFPKKGVNVKLIIKSDTGNVLLVKPSYKPTWQLPGGGVEEREEPKDTLIREVREELGLTLASDDFQIVGTAFRREYNHLFLIYEYREQLSEDTSLAAEDDEIEAYRFILPHEAGPLLSGYYAGFWHDYLKTLS